MVGHVEGRQSGVDVPPQLRSASRRIDRSAIPLHIRDLPQSCQHARNLQPGGELDPLHLAHTVPSFVRLGRPARRPIGSAAYSGGKSAKIASTSTPSLFNFATSLR